MKHVMTPVRLSDWLNALIMDATGDDILQVRAGRTAKDRSLEIVQAINKYDELVAQRDALVDACKIAYDAITSLPEDSMGEGRDGQLIWPIRDEVLSKIASALALALVRGEDV